MVITPSINPLIKVFILTANVDELLFIKKIKTKAIMTRTTIPITILYGSNLVTKNS